MIEGEDMFSNDYNQRVDQIREQTLNKYSNELHEIDVLVDAFYEMYRTYYAIYYMDHGGQLFHKIASGVLLNNLNYLMASKNLTIEGQYVQARGLYRNIYESLVMLKYASLSQDIELMEKIQQGMEVSLKRDIYKKVTLKNECQDILKIFWEHLCKFDHFTADSLALPGSLNCEDEDFNMNYVIAIILLCMNYHVFNSYCFRGNMKEKSDRYIHVGKYEISPQEVREYCRKCYTEARREVSPFGRKIIRAFVSRWELKMG